MYYSQKMVNHNDESAYISKDFVSINDKMSAICTVIDQKLYRLDAKL